eukprot:8258764-Alexandrium_andersonii.AAC.1
MLPEPVLSVPAREPVGQAEGDAPHESLVCRQAFQDVLWQEKEQGCQGSGEAGGPTGDSVPQPDRPLLC